MPVPVPPSANKLAVGAEVVSQTVPREVRALPPLSVTFAPRVAVVSVIAVAVGVVTTGALA